MIARVQFKDHFSGHAAEYARFRPTYPPGLFAYLASLAARNEVALDCGTGNGQAATGLAAHFRRVFGTDASAHQIAQALHQHARVRLLVAAAEHLPFGDHSVDLLSVAQALHWFDLQRFYREAPRLLRPGGIIAVYCYNLMRIDTACDAIIHKYYHNIIYAYWPPERRLLEHGYREAPFPFEELSAPAFRMTARWNLQQVIGYLATWSATQRYRAQNGVDPLKFIRWGLQQAWGEPDNTKAITWPLHLRVGRTGPN